MTKVQIRTRTKAENKARVEVIIENIGHNSLKINIVAG